MRVTSAAERRLFGAERKCQNQALWAVIRCAQFVKKEGAVVVPMSPGPDAPSAKPQFIMPLRNELLDTFTKRGDCQRDIESVVNRPAAIPADIMSQPERVAGRPI